MGCMLEKGIQAKHCITMFTTLIEIDLFVNKGGLFSIELLNKPLQLAINSDHVNVWFVILL